MKLHILSDLHLDHTPFACPATDADAVVLAGDLGHPDEAIAFAAALGKPVLFVAGNHEFYGGSIASRLQRLRELCAGTAVQLLDMGETVLQGVRFLGTTLWTDFRLDGDGAARERAMEVCQRLQRDYQRIRQSDDGEALYTPADAQARFERESAWLAQALARPHAGPTVVITHHGPSARSIHPRFAGAPINAGFVSRSDHLLGCERAALWVHGHTHDSFDYDADGTRVLCNPRGYLRHGTPENPRFDPGLVVDVQ